MNGPDLSVHHSLSVRTVIEVLGFVMDSVINLAEVSHKIFVSGVCCLIINLAAFVSIGIIPVLEFVLKFFIALNVKVNWFPVRNTFAIDEFKVLWAIGNSYANSISFFPGRLASMASVVGVFTVDTMGNSLMITSAIIFRSVKVFNPIRFIALASIHSIRQESSVFYASIASILIASGAEIELRKLTFTFPIRVW